MREKLCKETFEQKAIAVHGDKFDYSLVTSYRKADYITLICPVHGEYRQQIHRHLEGRRCKKCVDTEQGKLKSIGTEEFIKRAKAIHFDRYDYSKVEYKNTHAKVVIICSKHGDFLQTPNNHLKGRGCKKCAWIENGIVATKPDGRKAELYYVWHAIKGRCYNKNAKNYRRYGGRGIELSQEFHNYMEFEKYCKQLENYEYRKEKGLSLDRINNDGNYERGNLRWADNFTQSQNRSVFAQSGYEGIRIVGGKVYVTVNIALGYAETIEEGIAMRNAFIEERDLPCRIQTFFKNNLQI